MSAHLEKYQTLGLQGPTASVSGGYSPDDNLMRISAGPAALAQLIMYRVMSLYLQIIDLDKQQKVLESKAQYAETKAQADAIVTAGKWQGISMIVGASITLLGVAASIGYNRLSGKTELKNLSTKMEENEAQIAPLKKINELNPKAQSMEGGGSLPKGSDAEPRLAELENRDYKGSFNSDPKNSDPKKNDTWIKNTGDALGCLKKDKDFQVDCKAELNRLTQDQNSHAQKILSIMTDRSTKSQQLNTAVTALGQVSQGVGTVGKANNDALAALNATAANIAGSLTQEFGGAMSKALDAALQAIRTLLEIHRANSVQG